MPDRVSPYSNYIVVCNNAVQSLEPHPIKRVPAGVFYVVAIDYQEVTRGMCIKQRGCSGVVIADLYKQVDPIVVTYIYKATEVFAIIVDDLYTIASVHYGETIAC